MVRNPILTQFHEILNIFPAFCVAYSNYMDIIYYMVKDMRFGLHDILYDLAFYEILYLIDKYNEEVKEKNKANEEERDRMDSEMHKMRALMSQNNRQSSPSMPSMKMPNLSIPKI